MTILSMIFTVISVLLSVFEYALSSRFVRKGSVMFIKFVLQSQTIANMSAKEFIDNIIFRRAHKVTHSMSKTLGLHFVQVERSIPMQSNDGMSLMFIIDADSSRFDPIWQIFIANVQNGTIGKNLAKIYKIESNDCIVPENSLLHLKLNENQHLSVHMPQIVMSSLSVMSSQSAYGHGLGIRVPSIPHTPNSGTPVPGTPKSGTPKSCTPPAIAGVDGDRKDMVQDVDTAIVKDAFGETGGIGGTVKSDAGCVVRVQSIESELDGFDVDQVFDEMFGDTAGGVDNGGTAAVGDGDALAGNKRQSSLL